MSKYLNVFNTLAEYQAFSASTEYTTPNVALVTETNVIYYDYGDNKPQADMSDYKVESQETSVGGDKYGKDAITKINYIPSGITSLNSAFSNLKSLEEVTCELPSGVTSMDSTFSDCTSLVNAPEIPNSVTDMNSTFYNCKSLITAPNIPSSVTSMDSTFSDCTSLVNAPNIPSSVTSMDSTFNSCSSLVTAPVIPDTVTSMSNTFTHCSSLITAPEIPSGVTDIDFTFYNCSSIINAPSVIPSVVTNMKSTFFWCANIKELTFLMITPPTYQDTLYRCSKLESIYVPDEAVDAYKTATGWSEFASKFKPLSSKPTA